MSIEIRELVIKSTIRSSGGDNEEPQVRQSATSRPELFEECRKMVRQLVDESRRR